jgi:hypothetical protein
LNAEQEICRLLQESGAVLIRQNKHLVYRLPNGKNFVAAKTSSDPERAAKNSLSDLRRALCVPRIALGQEPAVMEIPQEIMNQNPQMNSSEAPRRGLSAHAEANNLRSRVESMIAAEEAAQEHLMAEAQQLERRVQMLKALLPFADDPATEAALKTITLPPPPPAAPAQPEPPQHITERVQVTRQLVLAATQTFEGTFTVNDVLALMTGGSIIDGQERLRVRSSSAQAMMTLYERGELIREAEGYGKRQAIWKKAVLNGNGNGVGVRA